ncbi:dipeptidase [Novosphingobium bradum]|uniref:Dipeptidase n=1 Tax=Novosphingobium bradum TaxID=1737444 RepID=A0ABV7IUS3_9SPHN
MKPAASFALAAGLLAGLAPVPLLAAPRAGYPQDVAAAALKAAPVWDGHNDVPEQLRDRRKDLLAGFNFRDTTATADPAQGRVAMHTDLARLRRGHVGAQFWSVFVPASLSDQQAVQAVMEQIDVTRRLIAAYPQDLQLATDAAGVAAAWKAGRIASLLGMEGGYAIGNSLGVLRQFRELGVRYMTLTHYRTTAWADSATDAPQHGGLTDFGRQVVREMQRIGMLVDLSHVSAQTMNAALDVARAPVIFSHSGARAIADHPRNVPDAVLARLRANGGIVMVVTLPAYVSNAVRTWELDRTAQKARLAALHVDEPDTAKTALAAWEQAHPRPRATLAELADHIDHIVKVAGIDHVGLGGDFDGMDTTTEGMADVSGYPDLFVELARRGYGQADLQKIASGNMMRVLKAADAYALAHRADPPIESATAF